MHIQLAIDKISQFLIGSAPLKVKQKETLNKTQSNFSWELYNITNYKTTGFHMEKHKNINRNQKKKRQKNKH